MARPSLTPQEWATRVRTLMDRGRAAEALKLAERALEELADVDPASLTRLQANRLIAMAELGDVAGALSVIDDLVARSATDVWIDAAWSMVLYRSGQVAAAITTMDRVLSAADNDDLRMRAHLNRGNYLFELGQLRSAQADLAEAARLAAAHGDRYLEFACRHNGGYLRFLTGDLPGALQAMAAAEDLMPESDRGMLLMDRARVLMAAGLLSEALVMAERSHEEMVKARTPADQAVALLLISDLRGRIGDAAGALTAARRARRIHRRRRTLIPEQVARLSELRWQFAVDGQRGVRAVLGQAPDLVDDLAAAGLSHESQWARLLWVEALVSVGDQRHAAEELATIAVSRSRVDIAQELQRAALESAVAPAPMKFRPLRKGLDRLGRHQARLGAPDLQAAASASGVQLARRGLELAVDVGTPASVLHWLERSRAVTSRLPPVTPPADQELADLLSRVRQLADHQRELRTAGRADAGIDRSISDLHDRIRARSWTVSSSGRPERPIRLSEARRVLAADPSRPTVVAYLTGQDSVWAVVITGTRAAFRRLGPWSDSSARHRRRHADLDLLAAPRIPGPLRKVARTSVQRELEDLDRALLATVADLLDTGPVIIAAVGDLATVPWLLLPTTAGRAVTVHSSVTAALRGRTWTGSDLARGLVAVSGPGVPTGEAEVAGVVAGVSGATALVGAQATGRRVLDVLPAGGLLHIAAHGHHESESPLFSHVLLADGPLYGYDIAPNPTIPAQVVLSACDVGRSSLQPGNEPLGLAAALLRSGVETVIAGVTRVNDEIAARTMGVYHRELAAGSRPAAALATAVARVRADEGELAAFTCFGSADLQTDLT